MENLFRTPCPYGGVGSRETPAPVLASMRCIGELLAEREFTLRSGHADGADMAFEEGCIRNNGSKEIYLPWRGFNGAPKTAGYIAMADLPEAILAKATDIAAKYHPRWQYLGRPVKLLHTRNVFQVLGPSLETPVGFVLCWTKDGAGGGGTGQAIRIAEAYGVPVYDLGKQSVMNGLASLLG